MLTPGGGPPPDPAFPPSPPGSRPPQVSPDQPTQAGVPSPDMFAGSATRLPGAPAPGAFAGSANRAPSSGNWVALSGSGERTRLPQPGSFVGPYQVERELARGGMGAVYLARHRQLGRVVALKVLLSERSDDARALERFQIEAEAVARLRHPGIVGVHEAGVHGLCPFLAMEFVQGESLQALLERDGPFEPRRAAELGLQMAQALEHAHQQGVLHRDMKPDNVLLDGDRARITDFGLAKQLHDTSRESLTKTGQLMGTPGYMPPEQASGERHDFGFPSDVWGLGATLYALLTGRPPFQGQTSVQVITKIIKDDPQPPSAHHEGIDAALDRICLNCLEKETADRYPTMAALAEDLRRYLGGESILAGPTRAQRRQRQRVSLLILGLGAVVALGLLVLGGRERLTAMTRASQQESAHALLVKRAGQALQGIEDTGRPSELTSLSSWHAEFAGALGPKDGMVRDVSARRLRLRRLSDARAAHAEFRQETNVNRRHLAATEWLRKFDAQDDERLNDLVAEVRGFHAERWLKQPLVDIAVSESRDRDHVSGLFVGDDLVLGAAEGGELGLFRLPAGELVERVRLGPAGARTYVMAQHSEVLWLAQGHDVVGYPRPTGLPLAQRGSRYRGRGSAETLAISSDGERALVAGGIDQENEISLGWFAFLELKDGAATVVAEGQLEAVVKAAVALPGERYLTVGGMVDGTGTRAILWRHGQVDRLQSHALHNRGESAAVSPDGALVAVGTSQRGVLLIEVSPPGDAPALELRGVLVPPLLDETDTASMLGVSPYVYGTVFFERWLVGSIYQLGEGNRDGVSGLVVWDPQVVSGGAQSREYVHKSEPVEAFAENGISISPDGRFVAQPTTYGRVIVWDGPATMPNALRERSR